MTDYYARRSVTHVDGTAIFQNNGDRQNERQIADMLARAWRCEIHSFGALAPIDWYAVRDGRTSALLELKSRTHDSAKFSTVFLNVRKWLALSIGSVGMGVPGIFVVRFTDGIRWVPISKIDARISRVAGCNKIVKSENDIEPIIEVPLSIMSVLSVELEAA